MKRVQAFGGGVQSVTLLRMILAGEVDQVDAVVFADTQAEPQHVYEVVEREKALCDAAGIPFYIVTHGNLATDWQKRSPTRTKASFHVPLFTKPLEGGRAGMLMRSCTGVYKIDVIAKLLRNLGWKKEGVELFMGISTDEIRRVKPSLKSYITNRYPLIEADMRRGDCHAYLARLGISAAKSACVFCPYRSAASWRAVKDNPSDWTAAVEYDRGIRDARPGYQLFVHVSCTPLESAVMDDEPSLFDDECAGVCGV
jgi:hypothetical protein